MANTHPPQGPLASSAPSKAMRWALALAVALAAGLSLWLWWSPSGAASRPAQDGSAEGEKPHAKAAQAPLAAQQSPARAQTGRANGAASGSAAVLVPEARTPTAAEDDRAQQFLRRDLRRAVAVRAFAEQAQALLRACAHTGPATAETPFQVTFRRDAGKGPALAYHAVDLRPATGTLVGRSRGCVESLRSLALKVEPGDLAEDELFTTTVALAVALAAEH